MQGTTDHFWALDVACAQGIEIEVDGKSWTFSPLRYRDLAALVAHARSEALKTYWDAKRGKPGDFSKDTMDLNSILFGGTAQLTLTDPSSWWLKVKLSLQRKHPQITDAEVDAMFEDEALSARIVEVVSALTGGPISPSDIAKEGEDGPGNPTETAPDGTR